MLERGLKRYAPEQHGLIDAKKDHFIIYHSERERFDLDDFGFGELPAKWM